ncbi:MAG: 16S rRNA (guanine(966)-N(2))-methyltransferase RsmD [Planctomycetota bacterium]|jgi:16S rRNA (guanine966-N2)-methyltransferase
MLKIISGEFRSRRIVAPPEGDTTRPYLARVRESVFGMLHGWFEDASVLDLFAGVGTVGLEAISRGARRVVMVEQDKSIYQLLRQNVAALGCQDRAVTLQADALGSTALHRAEPPVDLVFIDPPYAMIRDESTRERVLAQAARCRELMGDRGFVVLRSPVGPDEQDLSIPGLAGPEAHRYRRDMCVLLYEPQPREAGRGDEGLPTSEAAS